MDTQTGLVFYRRDDGALMKAISFENENGEVYTVGELVALPDTEEG